MSKEQYGVCVLRKYKRGAVSGIETHVERRASHSNTNPDILRSQSSRNFDLNGKYDSTFNEQIKSRISKTGATGFDRKNGVVLAEILFSATHEFFEGKNDNEIRQYFQECYNFASRKYGQENIVSAMVHLDEHTPHMHLVFMPIVKKQEGYKFCANDLFNHKMEELQQEVHEQVFSKYGLEKGEKKYKHMETLDYKIIKLQEKKEQLEMQIQQLEQIRDNNELYKLQRDLKSTRSMLSKMLDVVESDPELLEQYKKSIQEYEARKMSNNDREL